MQIFKKITFWLALLGLCASGMLILRMRANLTEPIMPPPVTPAAKPFPKAIGAAGIVEARSENTLIGAPVSGLVIQVHARVWDRVRAGDPLLTLDSRDLQANLAPQRSQVEVAKATLQRLRDQLARLEAVGDPRAVSAEDIKLRRSDIAVAEAQLEAALASVAQTERLIERMTVRAPIDGTILQVNIRAGEYLAANASQSPLVLGNIEELQVRADVDEQLAPRIRQGAKAVACLKGDSSNPIALDFSRIEPFIVPKRSLTGSNLERVDTRVLQVIFTFKNPTDRRIYVGQQMDIYIEE